MAVADPKQISLENRASSIKSELKTQCCRINNYKPVKERKKKVKPRSSTCARNIEKAREKSQ